MREIELTRNGEKKLYSLKYTLASCETLQEKLGVDFFSQTDRKNLTASATSIALFIQQGVVWQDPTITLEEIKQSVEMRQVPAFLQQCFNAFKDDGPVDLDPTSAPTTTQANQSVQ
jgi:hypothetical protein